ncbi:MAG: serine hydrolase [Clostridia bacterium]|nr:serine hydrolase [Clostridia bacterium]
MNKEELHELILKQQPNICQVVGYKNGKEVYSDEWNNYKKMDACHVMSVTKSIVSLLIGIAIDKGFIKSIDEKVLTFFPDYKIKRGEKTIQDVTIKHLLTMTAPYKYKYEPWVKICTSDDWSIAALDFLGGRKGITGEFKYSTLGIHILTGIISKTSGLKAVDFANKYLFEPIGVEKHVNFLAETAEEHKQFTISKEPKENVWFCDPQGVGTAGYGLCFSAEDMAKIGQLCLNKGIHNGKQIVPAEWIEEMIQPRYTCGEEFRNMLYGFLWWIIDEKEGIYAAIGNSGNVIYVNETKNIIIAVTSYFKPTIFDRVDFIREYVEKLVEDREDRVKKY